MDKEVKDLKEKAQSYHGALPSRIVEYLENRGISTQIITEYLIGWSTQAITIPIFNRSGEVSFFKYRKDPDDTSDKSKYWYDTGSCAELYGWERIKKPKPFLVICEGELDKLCLESNDIPAVTSTGGARTFKDQWITALKDSQSVLYICFDNDEVGVEASGHLAEKLRSAKIIQIPKEEGIKDITDYIKKYGKDKFLELGDNAKTYKEIEDFVFLKENPLPLSLPEFLRQDIPPVEYYVSGLLPKKGKGMISASTNIGKSIFAQNLALTMACGKVDFLGRFKTSPAKVLYLDLEMGKSALKERFKKMCALESLDAKNLYVKYLPSINLTDLKDQELCERWIKTLGIEVLIIDPMGNAWYGNENLQEEVHPLTAYLNGLIEKYEISLLIVHHWRKPTKEARTGGHMAAGSYRWEAWLDCHITLEGPSTNLTISSAKSRNMPKFNPFMVKLNPDTLWFEYLADFEKRIFDSTLQDLFESFNTDRVSIPQLIKRAKEQKICSATTLRTLIGKTTSFDKDSSGKSHFLVKKGSDKDLLR